MKPGPEAEDGMQLSLLQGFGAARQDAGVRPPAVTNPVAQVIIESPLPHLERPFDYLVPEHLDSAAVPGARAKVRFGAKEHSAFITRRLAESESGARLIALAKVVSAQPVLSAEVLQLAQAVADRYAGTVSDVLRVAVPPRVARVEKEFQGLESSGNSTAEPAHSPDSGSARQPDSAPEATDSGPARQQEPAATTSPSPPSLFTRYLHGNDFLRHLATGGAPRAVFTTLGGYGNHAWPAEIAEAVEAVWRAGRGAVVVVPDQRDLRRVEEALEARIGAENFVRLTAEDGPSPRYRNFLKLVHGQVRVAVGTRSAAYAPVRDLGLVCIWDDGDDLHLEQRAPYQHIREVLLLRAGALGCAALLASASRSTEAQRLVSTGWAQSIHAERSVVRSGTPRVLHSADAFHSARDPLAVQARIPHVAWKAAQEGLRRGPVLLQVARTGFSPALACQDCRTPARCVHCEGPLAQANRGSTLACRWCGRPDTAWRCRHCGSAKLRATVSGATRTAEELGRAFPNVPVISSAGSHIVDTVPDSPAVVVATPGAEPVAAGGYAAVILLDGTTMLARESLRAGEDTLRRWFTAALLARPADDGGLVVVTADDDAAVGHLVRWDPRGGAERELMARRELALPPSVRYAALTGTSESLAAFLNGLDHGLFLRTVGPVPVPPAFGPASAQPVPGQQSDRGGLQRMLVFFSYRDAAQAVARLKARKVSLSAKRTSEPVHIRCDAADLI